MLLSGLIVNIDTTSIKPLKYQGPPYFPKRQVSLWISSSNIPPKISVGFSRIAENLLASVITLVSFLDVVDATI